MPILWQRPKKSSTNIWSQTLWGTEWQSMPSSSYESRMTIWRDMTPRRWLKLNGSPGAFSSKLWLGSRGWLGECVDIWEVSGPWKETMAGFIILSKKLIMNASTWSFSSTYESPVSWNAPWSSRFKECLWTHFSLLIWRTPNSATDLWDTLRNKPSRRTPWWLNKLIPPLAC